MSETFEGDCFCAKVRFTVIGVPLGADICHCRSCRLSAGVAGVAWITVPKQSLRIADDHLVQFRSSPKVRRTFCGICGTTLTYAHDDDVDTVDVTIASLDEPERFAPEREIWLEDRLPWEVMDHRLAHFPKGGVDR